MHRRSTWAPPSSARPPSSRLPTVLNWFARLSGQRVSLHFRGAETVSSNVPSTLCERWWTAHISSLLYLGGCFHACASSVVIAATRGCSPFFSSSLFYCAHSNGSSRKCTTLLGMHRGVLGVLGVLQSTLWPENRTPDLELLLAQTALCWPRGNVGYKRSPHQSTTPRRETA